MERKMFAPRPGTGRASVAIKDAARGEIEAVFATFNTVDHDGDWTLPGAFEDGAPVRISAYGHGSWAGQLPVGKGVIRTTARDARLVGHFFLETRAGRDTFITVREMGALQEWSYGFDVLELGQVTEELKQLGVSRVLKRVKVHEVSPVLVGAGIGTRTVVAKSAVAAGDVREAALRELARFELLRAKLDAMRGERAALEAGELGPAEVPRAVRLAAMDGAAVAAEILEIEPPAIRFYAPATAYRVGAKGVCYRGEGCIWVAAFDDAEEAYRTAAHEVAHAAGFMEPAARRFGDALSVLRGVELRVGRREALEARGGGVPEGALVVEQGILWQRTRDGWRRVTSLV
jgi:hypothetical protein